MNQQIRANINDAIQTLMTGMVTTPWNVPHLLRRVIHECREAADPGAACGFAFERLSVEIPEFAGMGSDIERNSASC